KDRLSIVSMTTLSAKITSRMVMLAQRLSIFSRRLAWYCALARFSKSPRFNLQNGQRSTLARNLRLHFGFGHSLNGSGFRLLPLSAILLLCGGIVPNYSAVGKRR